MIPVIDEQHFNYKPRLARTEVVDRVKEFMHDRAGEPLHVAQVCRIAGVSERTLRTAFHTVTGLSPKRYEMRERLNQAHLALEEERLEDRTVTSIATDCGFYELGRFAGMYKSTFGETPSETLHRHRA